MKICMIAYSFYEFDGRVRRYAETLERRGHTIDVISLRHKGQEAFTVIKGVRVHQVQERIRDEKGKWNYFCRVVKFLFRSAVLVTRKHFAKPFDLVHVHSVPDFEVFAALIPKLLGARVILDIHDIVPELYCEKFNVKKNSFVFKALVVIERLSIRFSDHVIVSNDLWRERLISRSVGREKCTSILNFPDKKIFKDKGHTKNSNKTVMLYPGSLNFHQGLDIAVKAFGKIKDSIFRTEFYIYGEGPARKRLAQLIQLKGLQDRVFLKDPVPIDEIASIMAKADIGIIPKKNDGFGDEAFSTKALEFMTLGVPLIISKTKVDRFYFDDSVVKFFEPGNIDDLAEAMLLLINDQSIRTRLAVNSYEFAKNYCWDINKKLYLDLVKRLCHDSGD